MKLEKLTKEQEILMHETRDEWLSKLFDSEKRLNLDKDKAKKAINWLYTLSGLKEPIIVFVDSPLGVQSGVQQTKLVLEKLGKIIKRDQVSGQVRNQVWGQVRNQVSGQVSGQVRNQVWGQVRNQVSGQVWSQVRNQVWGQVSGQVGGQVRNQVSGQVRDQVGGQYEPFGYRGTIFDFNWISFYNFFAKIGLVTHEKFNELVNLLDCGIFFMCQLDGLVVACGMPNFIGRDNQNNLHCDDRSAISWKDGYEQFYLHGVGFDKELWSKVVARKMSFKEVMKIENMEQRQVALKYVPPKNLN